MRIIADTHVHLYSCYNLPKAMRSLAENLSSLDPKALSIGFLTEQSGSNFFSKIINGEFVSAGVEAEVIGDKEAALLRIATKLMVYLFPGRQLVTSEGIEILALALKEDIGQGCAAEETLKKIRDKGSIPVLSWAPGKWLFKRGRLVKKLLEASRPGELLIGDTSLRPIGWTEPRLFGIGRKLGLKTVCGSDPLPFAGEEMMAGRYASILEGEFKFDQPLDSVRRIFLSPDLKTCCSGRRSPAWSVGYRLYHNEKVRRRRKSC